MSFLSVKVSADDNLIDSNFTRWDKCDVVGSSSVTSTSDGYKVRVNSDSIAIYYRLPDYLMAGHTYNFTFCLKSSSGFTADSCLGFGVNSSLELSASDLDGVSIPLNELNSTTPQVYDYSFVCKDGVNNIIEFFIASASAPVEFVIKNIELIDVSQMQHQEILDNQNQNAQDIQDNADKNAQEIKDNADENTSKIGGWLSDLGDSIKSIFYITSYIHFEWEPNVLNTSTGLPVSISDSSTGQRTSDFFSVDGENFLLYVNGSGQNLRYIRLFKYDENYTYLSNQSLSLSSDYTLSLEPGYYYKVSILSNYSISSSDADIYVFASGDVFFVNLLVDKLVSSLKSLFVPSEEDLTAFKDNMQNLFADKLGFIYSAGDFLGNVLDSLSDLFSGNYLDGSMIITLPALSFNFLGFSIHLWDDTSINLSTLISGTAGISILYNIYKVMLHTFFITVLVGYAERIYKGALHST